MLPKQLRSDRVAVPLSHLPVFCRAWVHEFCREASKDGSASRVLEENGAIQPWHIQEAARHAGLHFTSFEHCGREHVTLSVL
jgi:hypothetical protein